MELEFQRALGAERDAGAAVSVLRGIRNEDANRARQSSAHFRRLHDLVGMGRADFLLTLGNQDKVHRHFTSAFLDRLYRREKGDLRALLIDGAAADNRLYLARPIDQSVLERGRALLGRIELLHVIHEVDAERGTGAGIEHREHTRDAVGGNDLGLLKACLDRQQTRIFCTLGRVFILGGDGRQRNPVTQRLDGGVMPLRDRMRSICGRYGVCAAAGADAATATMAAAVIN